MVRTFTANFRNVFFLFFFFLPSLWTMKMLLWEKVCLYLYLRFTVLLGQYLCSLLDDKLLRTQGSDLWWSCKQLLKALGSLQASPTGD